MENNLKISPLSAGYGIPDLSDVIRWAEGWDWGVGKLVADRLRRWIYTGWERVFLAEIDGQYAGFCTLVKEDRYGTDLDFTLVTPFIGEVYVDPWFRGRRLSKKVLEAACGYARSLGFDAVYLISSHVGLYEKYGFEPFKHTLTTSGSTEMVYRKAIVK